MIDLELLNILRSLDENEATKIVESLGDKAPQCYFCGHWDIEGKENRCEVCNHCGAEVEIGFGLGRIETSFEEDLEDITRIADDLCDGKQEEFSNLGKELRARVDNYLENYLLPCPHCGERNLSIIEEGRYYCEDCHLKGPAKKSDNPVADWNNREGRRDYGNGRAW